MADISKIMLPDGVSEYNIKDLYRGCEFIYGTQTASTNVWTGVSTDSELVDGKQILYFLPFAGTSSNATLNLTLADGTTTGAKNVYYQSTTRMTTHYAQYTQFRLIYHKSFNINGTNYEGWWSEPGRDTNTDTKVTQTATTTDANYEVLFSVTADNTTRTEGARKNSNLKFNPSTGNLQVTQINGVTVGDSPKFTDNNTTYTFANGTNGFTVTPSGGTAQTVTVTPSITNNVTGSGTSGYLTKWNGANSVTNGPQLGSSTTTYLRNDGSWATPTRYDADAVCSTAAGTAAKVASATGYTLTSGNRFTLRLTVANTAKSALTLAINSTTAKPIYINGSASSASNYTLPAGDYEVYYNGTNYYFRTDGKMTGSITGDAATVNGKTVGVNVPADAVFTDTKNTAGSTDTSSKIFLIGATSQAANPQTYSDNEVYVTNGKLTTSRLENGQNVYAGGVKSHAEGDSTTANGSLSHAEGDNVQASGTTSQ